MSDSDSDKTVDSDELGMILEKPDNQNRVLLRSTRLHDISDDSDSNDSKIKTPERKQKTPRKSNSAIKIIQEADDNRPLSKYGSECNRKNLGQKISEFDSNSDDNEIKMPEHKQKAPRKSNVEVKLIQDADNRPICKYGSECYRKNPEHHREFQHPKDEKSFSQAKRMKMQHEVKKITEKWHYMNNFNFFLTTVNGINPKYNQTLARGIKDLLRPSEGRLKASAQFNYMVDVPWLIHQYPHEFRNCPLLIVHGEQRDSKRELEQTAKSYPNITFCQAKLEIMYGTHHTKMMLLLYEDGLRVIIHTSNLIDGDWYQKTQGMWVSPKFPPLPASSITNGESCTMFKADLIEYLSAYNDSTLVPWCENIRRHDMSSARVFLIGSVPGRHIGSRKTAFGHLKLRKILTAHSASTVTSTWPVIGQFSSIGSLGANQNQWLCGEWLTSLSTVKGVSLMQSVPLKLIFPSVDNVRCSLEGYPAGACLPYSKATASKQPYLSSFLHQWKSRQLGRSTASPHIKSYCRISPDMKKIAWFLVTSANLSKAAWGALEKNGSQLMIRSYEVGVLFIPQYLCNDDYFIVGDDNPENNIRKFPLPFDVPLTPYESSDEPWIWDIPHIAAPDRHGNMWCPPR